MAAGTFVTAKLMRNDQQTPWGFRLQGGQEFQMPLSMVKVSDGSLAEQAGVQVGDIILKINGKECNQMKHKDAQDCIINAGNYLELYLERGPMNTWRPSVQPVGNIEINNNNIRNSTMMDGGNKVFTKTSLAKMQQDDIGAIGSGHNSMAKPFGVSATNTTIGGPKLVHKQFNSPINLYSEKSLEETLNAHTQVLSTGATGINFMKPDVPINKDSAVLKMIQEEDARKAKGLTVSPEKNGFHDPTEGPIRHVTAPSGPTRSPGQDERNRNICANCERLIVGVFVRVNNKSLHADCFICSTCGTSLKNIGYFNINDKLYCDIHAKQMKQVLSGNPLPDGTSNLSPGPVRSNFSQQQQQQQSPKSQVPSFGGGGGFGGINRVSPPSFQANLPQNGYNSNFNSTTAPSSFSSPLTTKKFSPVSVPAPPTAPKPAFGPGIATQQNQNQRNSMYGGMPSMGGAYNYTTTTHESTTVNQNYPGGNFGAPPAAAGGPNAAGPGYVSSTFASQTRTTYSVPPAPASAAAPAAIAPVASSFGANAAPSRPGPGFGGGNQFGGSSGIGQQATTGSTAPAKPRGKAFLQSQLTSGGAIPFCGYCSQPIRGQYIMALNKTWCPNHFICANNLCKRSLEQQGFVEEQGRLYCENCYETHFAPNCTKCHQRIKGDCLNALDKQWHPECFTCHHCRKPFGNSSFYLEDGFPYCEFDWNNLFTTKCVSCGYPIAAGDRWVEAMNQNYHSTCFRCTVCGQTLEGQSFFAKGGRPYCKAHAR